MSNIAVQRVENGDLKAHPIFEQIEKRLDDVRRRAFELFEIRGCEPGHELDDWLKAEREVLGWPPLETQESDSEYEFHVSLDGFDVKQMELTVSPSEIIVQAQADTAKKANETIPPRTGSASKDMFRRIVIPQPIAVHRTKATLDKGTLRITAAKAASERMYRAKAAG